MVIRSGVCGGDQIGGVVVITLERDLLYKATTEK